MLFSSVIKVQATKVIDVCHFRPMGVSPTGSAAREMRPSAGSQSVLLVDDHRRSFPQQLAPGLRPGL